MTAKKVKYFNVPLGNPAFMHIEISAVLVDQLHFQQSLIVWISRKFDIWFAHKGSILIFGCPILRTMPEFYIRVSDLVVIVFEFCCAL